MRDAVRAANNYLFWACANTDCEFVSREALIKLYKQFSEVKRLRRPVMAVEKMTNACLLEEVALAALSVKYDAHARFILDQLTPGRAEFEALCVHSTVCAAFLHRYRHGELPWAEAVDLAYRELLRLIELTANELGMAEVKLPDLGAGFGLREKVQHCVVLSDLLKGYQRIQIEQATVHVDPVMLIPPDMT